MDLLDDTLGILDDSTRDISRLRRVLSTNKVFGLVPEMDLENAITSMKDEVKPQLNAMIRKIESELNKLKRKNSSLAGKVNLQQVRLENATKSSQDMPDVLRVLGRRIEKGVIDENKLSRLKFIQNKKERLKYSLSRMNLQDKRARLSMIPSLPPQDR